jgi:hypothetical protein
MAAAMAASGGGSAAAMPDECPTNFLRFERHAPRESLSLSERCTRFLGISDKNYLLSEANTERLGPVRTFARYDYLYNKHYIGAKSRKTSSAILTAFDFIETARKLAIAQFRAKKHNPRAEIKPSHVLKAISEAKEQIERIRSEDAQLATELSNFSDALYNIFMSQLHDLTAKARKIGSAFPTTPTVDPGLLMRLNELKKTPKTRRNRKGKRATRRYRRRS